MNITVHISADFKTVYLLNGAFSEHADTVTCRKGEPVYITVLPLSAHLLPYTVKVLDDKVLCNEGLCSIYKLAADEYFIKMKSRYNYVYSPSKGEKKSAESLAEKFFFAVKNKRFELARDLMTDELKASITNDSIYAFFADYKDILENKFTPKGGYLLIDSENRCVPIDFETKSGLIDNIVVE